MEVEFIIPGTEKVVRCRAITLNIKEDGDFFGTSVRFLDILQEDKKSIEKAVDNLISEFWYILEE